MKLLIGADLVPTESNVDLFCTANGTALVGQELLKLLQEADYRIFNLEVPLTDTQAPIAKCGPALIAPTAAIAGYKALGIDCLTIANNHVMDQGEQGFYTTLQTLEENDIAYVGGGKNLEDAARPYIVDLDGKKIGIYACAEHEFSIAEECVPGANPFDPLESLDHVTELKSHCDYCIVLYHGGKEHYRYPSPNLQKVCRKLVEKGADLVICQHSHCIGCEEKYLDGTIVYGQGNFLFDHSTSEYWQTSLLVQVNDGFLVSYLPLVKNENTVRLAQAEMADRILTEFQARSEEIKDPAVIQKYYADFAERMRINYLVALGGKESLLFRALNKLTGNRLRQNRLKRRYGKGALLAVRNMIECEAHRELLLEGVSCE